MAWEPLVTVVMPVRNEEFFIAASLRAVLEQDYPATQIEVVVADGQSEDHTRAIIRATPGAERVRIIDNPRQRQACGLNLALRHARGEIVARVDGHTIIAQDYIRQCARALRETGAASVGGRMEPKGVALMGRAIAAAGTSRFGVPAPFRVSDQPQYTDTVYLGAWRRETLVAAGGFDERLLVNEDYELNYRLRQAGGRIYLTPAIRSTYFGRQTLWALARQYWRYGWDRVNTLRIHPRSLQPRQLVAPAFTLALAAGLLALPLGVPALIALLALLGIYMVADLVACALLAPRAGWREALAALAVFPTMHLAWGVGFWISVGRIGRWMGRGTAADASPNTPPRATNERAEEPGVMADAPER